MDTYEAAIFYIFLQVLFHALLNNQISSLILTDDQGYGDVQAHGHPYLKTPNMNKLRVKVSVSIIFM